MAAAADAQQPLDLDLFTRTFRTNLLDAEGPTGSFFDALGPIDW